MINSKNYWIIIIPYITICCGLYHLCYWNCFDLNGLSFISLSDIVKSAIQPLMFAIVANLFSFLILSGIIKTDKEKNKLKHSIEAVDKIEKMDLNKMDKESILIYQEKLERDIEQVKIKMELIEKRGKEMKVYFIFYTIIKYISFSILIFIFFKKSPTLLWIAVPYLIGDVLLNFVKEDFVFHKEFQPVFDKLPIMMLMIYFFLFSISFAYRDAYDIIKNKSYKYYTLQTQNPLIKIQKLDTMKLLGITEKGFVFINMGNDKITFIKADTISLNIKKKKPDPGDLTITF
jgi:hypothetical protein